MNDFREYVGIDYTPYLMHYGVSKRDGAKVGSGRYPLGSGDRPYQDYGGVSPKTKHNAEDKASKKLLEKARRIREKDEIRAKKDAFKDINVVRTRTPGYRGSASTRDRINYLKRHPYEDYSLLGRVLSKRGGMKVSKEYAHAYKEEVYSIINELAHEKLSDAALMKLKISANGTKFRIKDEEEPKSTKKKLSIEDRRIEREAKKAESNFARGKETAKDYDAVIRKYSRGSETEKAWAKVLEIDKNKYNYSEEIDYDKARRKALEGYDKARLNVAKKEKKYDLNFLEAIQNKPWRTDDTKMLTEYKKYLKDPYYYMEHS